MVEFDHAVVAVTGGSNGAEKIPDGCRQAADQVSGPKPIRTDQVCRERTHRNRELSHLSLGLVDPGIGRLRGFPRQTNDVLLFLKGQEVKGLVLDDGSAYRAAVVQVAQFGRLGYGRRCDKERRRGAVGFIALVKVSGAM